MPFFNRKRPFHRIAMRFLPLFLSLFTFLHIYSNGMNYYSIHYYHIITKMISLIAQTPNPPIAMTPNAPQGPALPLPPSPTSPTIIQPPAVLTVPPPTPPPSPPPVIVPPSPPRPPPPVEPPQPPPQPPQPPPQPPQPQPPQPQPPPPPPQPPVQPPPVEPPAIRPAPGELPLLPVINPNSTEIDNSTESQVTMPPVVNISSNPPIVLPPPQLDPTQPTLSPSHSSSTGDSDNYMLIVLASLLGMLFVALVTFGITQFRSKREATEFPSTPKHEPLTSMRMSKVSRPSATHSISSDTCKTQTNPRAMLTSVAPTQASSFQVDMLGSHVFALTAASGIPLLTASKIDPSVSISEHSWARRTLTLPSLDSRSSHIIPHDQRSSEVSSDFSMTLAPKDSQYSPESFSSDPIVIASSFDDSLRPSDASSHRSMRDTNEFDTKSIFDPVLISDVSSVSFIGDENNRPTRTSRVDPSDRMSYFSNASDNRMHSTSSVRFDRSILSMSSSTSSRCSTESYSSSRGWYSSITTPSDEIAHVLSEEQLTNDFSSRTSSLDRESYEI
uniref:AlNc14C158G7691 protein n=1 Tax=Albugo laibachii Nc14 TaxID=890382 RepID=F0WMK1_9STRA|nr:AlNc14C158G7691 [Albugo laibachii Nc14]|eukprot:CCA22533.1 AlNc14C158G7691 [Albugo laibachii Nc14]